MLTSLVGNKIFSSLYDPNIDALISNFRKSSETSLSSLKDVVSQGVSTQNILSKIPGVTNDTKNQLNSLLEEAKTFTTGAAGMNPSTIISKKAEIAAKIDGLVKTAQDEGAVAKEAAKAAACAAKKEAAEMGKFSLTKLYNRVSNYFKWGILIIVVITVVLWGGSISSNSAIDLPPRMRFYYFIYGSILFPISLGISLYKYINGTPIKYHAYLAPLYEGTDIGLFSFKSLMVEPVGEMDGNLLAASEAAIKAQMQKNAAVTAAVPLASAALPLASAALPLASAALPLASAALPLAKSTMSLASAALPLAKSTMPLAKSALLSSIQHRSAV